MGIASIPIHIPPTGFSPTLSPMREKFSCKTSYSVVKTVPMSVV